MFVTLDTMAVTSVSLALTAWIGRGLWHWRLRGAKEAADDANEVDQPVPQRHLAPSLLLLRRQLRKKLGRMRSVPLHDKGGDAHQTPE